MSIKNYLINLQNELYVNGTEREKIRKSIDAISARLDSYFGYDKRCKHKIIKKEIFGSYSRETMLSRKYDERSDIDYMIVFEDSKSYTPQTCLNWLKEFAEFWYPNSIVKQSLPTVVVELENIKFELVPAYEEYRMKYVAWDSANWQYTNTEILKNEMLDINEKTQYKFKRLIRIIKYWNIKKNYRKYKSYELERFLTEKFAGCYFYCDTLADFIDWAFHHLRNYEYVDEYVSKRIENANYYISEAVKLEEKGDIELAEKKIRKIFE